MKETSPQKHQVTLNGTTLWSRDGGYGQMVFARQLEPSGWMHSDDEKAKLTTPILVGYDGESGQDLIQILNENASLKRKVDDLEAELRKAAEEGNYWRWQGLEDRVSQLERPWYRRLFSR